MDVRLRASLLVVAILALPVVAARDGPEAAEPAGKPPAEPIEPLPGEHESGRVLAVRYALAALAGAACLLALYVAFSRSRRSGTGRR